VLCCVLCVSCVVVVVAASPFLHPAILLAEVWAAGAGGGRRSNSRACVAGEGERGAEKAGNLYIYIVVVVVIVQFVF